MRFRKLLATLLALTLILGISAPFAQGVLAEPASDEDVGWADIDGFAIVIADETLNLRAEPSTSAERLAQMPRGAAVIVVEWGNPWSLVIYAEQTSATEMEVFAGFAMSEYLSLYEEPVEVPDEPGWSGEEITATIIAEKSLYLREAPSTSARIIATMLRGETVSVVERGDTWSLVLYPKYVSDTQFDICIGYCMTQYLQFPDDPEAPDQPEDPNWPDTDESTATATELLNLRQSASTSATRVTQIPEGETVIVLDRGETWCQVRYGSYTGYCMTRYLRFSDDGSSEVPDDPDWSDELTATATELLNLRQSASTSATRVTQIPEGETVIVLDRGETWCQVRYGSYTGYCMTQYLQFPDDPETPDQPEDPNWPDTDESTATATELLNLRQSASTSATRVTQIPGGETVIVLDRGETWCQVRYGSYTGYCMTRYLRFSDDGSSEVPDDPDWSDELTATATELLNLRQSASTSATRVTQIPGGETVIVLDRGETWCQVRYGSYTGYCMTQYLQFPDDPEDPDQPEDPNWPDTDESTATATELLNLRQSPSTSATRVTQIPGGETVIVLDRGETWCQVRYGSYTGYCMTRYLRFSDDGSSEVPDDPDWSDELTATATELLNLRQSASTSATRVTQIPGGETVIVLDRGETWCQVRYGSYTGYCMTQYLQFPDDPETPDQPEDPNWPDTDESTATATELLNLRRSPSTSATRVTQIPGGETVIVLDKGETWCQVRYGSYTGYCMTRYLRFSDDGSSEVPDDPDWSDEPTATATELLNLRRSPSTSATRVTQIPGGETVIVLDKGETWCQVRYGSYTGYCMTQYLQFPDDPETPDQPEDPNWPDTDESTATATELLNLRQSASTSATRVTQIPGGETVIVLDKGETWCQVRYGSYTGYCMTRYLRFSDDSSTEVPDDPDWSDEPTATATELLNLRRSPSTSATRVTQIPGGETVIVLDRGETWCQVRYGSYTGYCMTQYLRFSDAA